jgi:hypothetical protein
MNHWAISEIPGYFLGFESCRHKHNPGNQLHDSMCQRGPTIPYLKSGLCTSKAFTTISRKSDSMLRSWTFPPSATEEDK